MKQKITDIQNEQRKIATMLILAPILTPPPRLVAWPLSPSLNTDANLHSHKYMIVKSLITYYHSSQKNIKIKNKRY